MATTLLIISAIYFLITNGIDTLLYNVGKDVLSPWHRVIQRMSFHYENKSTEKICSIISWLSLLILLPTSISLAFHINWFLAFLIGAVLLKFIVQGFIVNIYIAIIRRANLYSSMIITFIIGVITLIIGILTR